VSTTGDDALLVLYSALPREEQDAGYERITAHRLSADAASEDDMARYIRSLRRVVEQLGRFPTTTEYKTVSSELIAGGEDLESFARVYGRFGSWRRAAEALGLADSDSPRRVEARFKFRQRGRPHRFTDAQLADAMALAAAECRGVPTTEDYTWWRHGQLEVANAQGDHNLMLPSLATFRRRWGSWREALVGCGYTKEQVVERMGYGRPTTTPWTTAADETQAAGLPVAQLPPERLADIGAEQGADARTDGGVGATTAPEQARLQRPSRAARQQGRILPKHRLAPSGRTDPRRPGLPRGRRSSHARGHERRWPVTGRHAQGG